MAATKSKRGKQQRIKRSAALKAIKQLDKMRTGIVLTGRVENGRVVLDESCLKDIKRDFGRANVAFVAVNAPFDSRSRMPETSVR